MIRVKGHLRAHSISEAIPIPRGEEGLVDIISIYATHP